MLERHLADFLLGHVSHQGDAMFAPFEAEGANVEQFRQATLECEEIQPRVGLFALDCRQAKIKFPTSLLRGKNPLFIGQI